MCDETNCSDVDTDMVAGGGSLDCSANEKCYIQIYPCEMQKNTRTLYSHIHMGR